MEVIGCPFSLRKGLKIPWPEKMYSSNQIKAAPHLHIYELLTHHRGNVRRNTIAGRKQLMKILEQDKLGSASIDSIKMSDAKGWALCMKENGFSYNPIKRSATIRGR